MNMSISSSTVIGSLVRKPMASAAAQVTERALKEGAGKDGTDGNTVGETGQKPGSVWPRRMVSSDGPRVEVDRRIEESKAVKITVVSYSDGSSESITQMKADELVGRMTDQLERSADAATRSSRRPLTLEDKGLLVNKMA